MNIQWYPGHMVKTKRQISESLKLIDVVIELLDARAPISSKNPDIDEIISNKPKIVILNKADLADEKINKEWINFYKSINIVALDVDCITGKNINKIFPSIKNIIKNKLQKDINKGIIGRPVRALVVGIPNVGKSTFINKIANKSTAQTGDRPGVTKSKQWIKVNNEFELMDTPGILWPKFDDEMVALHLAYIKAIKEEILDIVELSIKFIDEIKKSNPNNLKDRFKIEIKDDPTEMLKDIGRKRGCIVAGSEIDMYRAANVLMEEFRIGKLGRISLETPNMIIGVE
ncbi:Ribosome biogenesis GTPase A [Caloramator mitchellensis]|uniref:Ribosome biogenesis GTPase A n=1 Tax=Caloramator mitchellensis TaxID=908809 RepID=A0A0R3K1W7_CALMK|nr:ribosome biogenesis GTPase YlqF [Caloramator mitchellensis]KRQ86965.1 Ribosome biogenesis GTPase A [Caloramator mitchellensis]